MGSSSTISSKGQVTLPVEVRRRLGVKAGDRIEYVVQDGLTVVRPVRDDKNPFEAFLGALGKGKPKGHAVKWVRQMRDPDAAASE